jgi:hypothetical protein
MTLNCRTLALALGCSAALVLAGAVPAAARRSENWKNSSSSRNAWAPHHGEVHPTRDHRFETVLTNDEVTVFVYGTTGQLENVEEASGNAKLRFKDGSIQDVTLAPGTWNGENRENMGNTENRGNTSGESVLEGRINRVDLSANPVTRIKLQLKGLPGRETHVSYTENWKGMREPSMSQNMSQDMQRSHRMERTPRGTSGSSNSY